jgi:hypothetical protein
LNSVGDGEAEYEDQGQDFVWSLESGDGDGDGDKRDHLIGLTLRQLSQIMIRSRVVLDWVRNHQVLR